MLVVLIRRRSNTRSAHTEIKHPWEDTERMKPRGEASVDTKSTDTVILDFPSPEL